MLNTDEIKQYEEYLIEEELAFGTRKLYLHAAERLAEYLSGKALTKSAMLAYKNRMASTGYAVSTQNLYIIASNRYLSFIGRDDCRLKTNRIQSRHSITRALSMEEYQSLLMCAQMNGKNKYYAIMKTLAMTGIRVGELKYFTVEALDMQVIQVTNKNKTREICLPYKLTEELKKYCVCAGIRQGHIFCGRAGKAIDRSTVYKMLVRIADMANVPRRKVYPHSFRHLFAQTYMGKYTNLFELADILGHSNLETTRIYARSTAAEKIKKLNELGL